MHLIIASFLSKEWGAPQGAILFAMKRGIICFFIIIFFAVAFSTVLFCYSSLPNENSIYTIEFKPKGKIGSDDIREELFFYIAGVEVDSQGNIFILDSRNNCLKKFSRELKFLSEAGREGQGPGEFNSPMALAISSEGNVYIADDNNNRINVFDNNPNFLHSIKLRERVSIRKIFIDKKGNIIIFCIPKLSADNYFSVYSPEGVFLRSFFNELHPFAPRMKSPKDLPLHFRFLAYLGGLAAQSHDREKIAFTYEIPENPIAIHIFETEGHRTKTIKMAIKNYDPLNQRKNMESIVTKNKAALQGRIVITYLRGIHFLNDGSLLVQRWDQIYNDGNPAESVAYLDLFSQEGKLLLEGIPFTEDIISIDSNNNVYASPLEQRSKLTIYSLSIKKKGNPQVWLSD